ncbi:multidrug resistance efflux pump [Rhodopirellula rubra]|uniref:Multidrug resistance efflux pump n=1 Tax=Aporhodopirellula rubra TaxID=980271 RepID=A0A7W5E0X5_9BACT|nr:HlyD family secretion protein [Aporhodopirellula rubra]MBB3207673.1 multidrug resistance efflux pump [Aporhodopirellula rubra]
MSWILGGIYCGVIWLVFAKLKLMRLSLPMAIMLASVGPLLIIALLFCAQYFHPFTSSAIVLEEVIPITPQLSRSGRVTRVAVQPNVPIKTGDVLFQVDRVPYENALARLEASLQEARQAKEVAEASVDLAQAKLDQANSDLEFATANRDRQKELMDQKAGSEQDLDAAVNQFNVAQAARATAKSQLVQALLSVDVAVTQTKQIAAQRDDAQYDLDQTTVIAPGNGFVTNLQLRPGMLVGGGVTGSVMSFVLDSSEWSRGVVVATFDQKNYLRIQPGQYAEVALNGYPGDIFTARVLNTIDVSGAGQMATSGTLPTEVATGAASPFAVRIKLDRGDELRIPGGSRAIAAVYTEDVQIAGIPIMFLIRAKSWLRYLM